MLLSRKSVAEMLGVSVRRSFDLCPSDTELGVVTERRFTMLLNARRNSSMHMVSRLPAILSLEQAASLSGATPKQIVAWTRRIRRPLPCWRITQKTVLFESRSLREWLAAHGVPVSHKTTSLPTTKQPEGFTHG